MRRRPRARSTPRLTCVAIALATAIAIAGCGGAAGSAPSSTSTQLEGAALPGVTAPPFTLRAEDGGTVSLQDYRGQVVVLAFIYSDCAACTLIAQQIRGALGELAHPVPVLIVTVDPAHDSPARVASFLRAVGLQGRARYLIGSASALPAVWRAYHVRTPTQGRAAFEAAASVLVIDPLGRERVIYGQEQLTPEALSHDIGTLQAG